MIHPIIVGFDNVQWNARVLELLWALEGFQNIVVDRSDVGRVCRFLDFVIHISNAFQDLEGPDPGAGELVALGDGGIVIAYQVIWLVRGAISGFDVVATLLSFR